MTNTPFEIVYVSKEELRKIWRTPVKFTKSFTEAAFDKQWEKVRDKIRQALGRRWTEGCEIGDDFMVSDDRNNAWTQCGGVYSARACCPNYSFTILQVIASTSEADKWAYHTAVEVWRPEDGFPITPRFVSGQFVLKAGRMFVPNDGYNYSRFFPGK